MIWLQYLLPNLISFQQCNLSLTSDWLQGSIHCRTFQPRQAYDPILHVLFWQQMVFGEIQNHPNRCRQINSQYCTNPTWLAAAICNPVLFQVTLYASSLHMDGLYGSEQSMQSLNYKYETIKVLNKVLKDSTKATSDETISAVLFLGSILVS